MIRHTPEFDQRIADWLEADPAAAPADVLSTVVAALPSIPQARRGLLAPWRFFRMSNFARAAAGVAIVAIVGVGILAFNSRSPLPGSTDSPAATGTAAPTVAAAPTLPPGIPGWTRYTSDVYGFTMAYPSDWSVSEPASQKWPAGRGLADAFPYADVFVDPTVEIVFSVWEMPAPAGVSLRSVDGMAAALPTLCESIGEESCEPAFAPTKMCLGPRGLQEPAPGHTCRPVVIALLGEKSAGFPWAFVGDPETGVVTVFQMGRPDDFPAAASYGGTRALLMAIVGQLDVR